MKIKFKDGIVIECLDSDNKSKKEIIEEAMKVHEEIKDDAKIYKVTPDLVYKSVETFVNVYIGVDVNEDEGQLLANDISHAIENDLLEYETDSDIPYYEDGYINIDYRFDQAYITEEELNAFENDLREELSISNLQNLIDKINTKGLKMDIVDPHIESRTVVDDEKYEGAKTNDSYKYLGTEKVKELSKNGNLSLVKSKGNGEFLDEYLVLEGEKTKDKIDAKNDKEAIKTFKLKFADNLSEEFVKKVNEEINGRPFEVFDEDNNESYIYYVELQIDGNLCAGTATNTGLSSEYCIQYDNTISLDENLNKLYDIIVENKFGVGGK